MSKVSKQIISNGGQVKRFAIDIGKNGRIGTFDKMLSDNGFHEFIEVIKDGKSYIYDNLHIEGALKEDYIKAIAGQTNSGKVLEGENLMNLAKEIK